MKFKPAAFASVPFNTHDKSACSPEVKNENKNTYLIRIPDEIETEPGEKLIFPICGYYCVETFPILRKSMYLHLKNRDGKTPALKLEAFTIHIEHELEDPSDKEPLEPKLFKNSTSRNYFYLNGGYYVPTQFQSGEYDFCMTYGPLTSNTVKVKIRIS